VPYVPTPEAVVEKVLEMAAVTNRDVVYCSEATVATLYLLTDINLELRPDDQAGAQGQGCGLEVSSGCLDACGVGRLLINQRGVPSLSALAQSRGIAARTLPSCEGLPVNTSRFGV